MESVRISRARSVPSVSALAMIRKGVPFLSFLFLWLPAHAQIVTDGTVGPAVSLQGPDYRVGHELGSRAGSNLFHSFRRFGIAHGESAVFTGPDDIKNVVSRVTGGEASNIDGLLRSEVGRADFYFVNPAGVVFGENAQVDVPAAFHASTADEVRFSDGAVFSASEPGRSTLAVAAPESFGFLSPQPASVEVNGSLLEFKPGSSVSLSGGDLSIQGTGESPAGLVVEGGEIRLTAVGSAGGEVPVAGVPPSEATRSGALKVENGRLDATGDGGGTVVVDAGPAILRFSRIDADNSGDRSAEGGVRVRARSLSMTSSDITADSLAKGAAGTVDARVSESMGLWEGARISSSAYAEGNAGDIRIEAGELRMDACGEEERFTGIASQARSASTGDAGNLEVRVAGRMEVLNGGAVFNSTFGAGDAGGVKIEAGRLKIDGRGSEPFTGIASQSNPDAAGDAGAVEIVVPGSMEVLNGGAVSSDTFSVGKGGDVVIEAGELVVDGGGSAFYTYVSSDTLLEATPEGVDPARASSRAGTVTIRVREGMRLANNGQIASRTNGPGHAGSVKVEVSGRLEVLTGSSILSSTYAEGDGGSVTVEAGELRIDDRFQGERFTGVSAQANSGSTGHAGSVEVSVSGWMEVLNGGKVSTSTSAAGNGGSVKVEAGELRIDGGGSESRSTGIWSNANAGSAGDAGTVQVTVSGLLEVLGGSLISSATFASGDGGDVKVDAERLRIDDRRVAGRFTGIASVADSGSAGNAGNVDVKVSELLEVLNGGGISCSTFGAGDGGSVKVEAGRLKIDAQGSEQFTGIASQADVGSTGNAGTVEVVVSGLLEVLNGGIVSSVTFAEGDGGSVKVEAGDLKIENRGAEDRFTGIASRANPDAAGLAGDIEIRADRMELLNGGAVSIAHYGEVPAERLESFRGGSLRIEADSLELQGGSEITARSTGNVPASSVEITVGDKLVVEGSSRITTSAAASDGGSLSVTGPGYVLLRDGLITTSAEGGRGGDIVLSPEILILDTGFVQANTAEGAQGGDISVGSQAVIAEGDRLEIGGEERLEFRAGSGINVIQAAAPQGNPGDIVVTAPEADISAALANVGATYVVPARLATDPCLAGSGAGGGTLTLGGRGGVPAGPEGPSTSASREDDRLTGR